MRKGLEHGKNQYYNPYTKLELWSILEKIKKMSLFVFSHRPQPLFRTAGIKL